MKKQEHHKHRLSRDASSRPSSRGSSLRSLPLSRVPLERDVCGVFRIPTETVEGYAVKLNDIDAIKELMILKDRGFDSGKIFTLVPENIAAISKYVIIPDAARPFIDKYLPGELTLILPKNPTFKHYYYDHYDTIGIRIPDYQPFQEILTKTGPLILTSANKKGGTPKSITGHKPSTIIDFTSKKPTILRQGNLIINLDDDID